TPDDNGEGRSWQALADTRRRRVDPRAARFGRHDVRRRLEDDFAGHDAKAYTSPTAIAVASPPPMHRVAMPRFLPSLRSAPISVTTIRAPDAPIGWPSAHAPPCTLTVSGESPSSSIAAMGTT